MSSSTIIFYIIAAAMPICGIFITIGYIKGKFQQKIQQNTDAIEVQDEQIKTLATKDELAAAIQRSNEMLEFMKERAEEDRAKWDEQWREFNNRITLHAERLSSLEAQQNTLGSSLSEIKASFREMEKDIKEILRKLPQ